MNLNKATILGNLTHDPEVRTFGTGQSVTTFSVATNAAWRDARSKTLKQSTEFTPVVAWGKLGSIVGQYARKGDRLYIEGRLATRQWEGKDNVKRSRTEVVAQNVIFLGSARKGAKPTAVSATEAPVEGDLSRVPVAAV
ncbi:MAG: single-stranded DNA-binding protein [Patescibacteria group bacterium]|jgi:single-strand DNA-binding protein